MKRKSILLVFGTRPEAIKMAPLIHRFKNEHNNFKLQICVTAQHRHMLDQVLKVFEIKPDIDLNLMRSGQDLTDITISTIDGMRKIFSSYKPDAVLVHGDTTTAAATALAAFYAHIPIGHVEAGLRTYNLQTPFPEEFNRQFISKVTRWHFAPTSLSEKNLLSEGIKKSLITVTGNTVIDSLYWALQKIETNKHHKMKIQKLLDEQLNFNWNKNHFILVTGHRRENFGNGFLQICAAIRSLTIHYPLIHFIYPVHLNPNVIKPVYKLLKGLKNVHLIKPLEYEPFIYLLKHSYLVLTDSGGIQEEAPSLGKPVLVMREMTERPEALEAGTVELVGTKKDLIINSVSRLLDDKVYYNKISGSKNPYGDGKASLRIINVLRN